MASVALPDTTPSASKVFGLAFCAAVVLRLALDESHSFSLLGLVAAIGATGVVVRLFAGLPVPLTPSVLVAALALTAEPIGHRLASEALPAAITVQRTGAWSECLMLALGGRLVAVATREAFDRRWRSALRGAVVPSEQSAAAALLLGMAATLAVLELVPTAPAAADALSVSSLLRSALLGATAIHVAILVAAATALALIASGFAGYFREYRAVVHFRAVARRAAGGDAAAVRAAATGGRFAATATAVLLDGLLSNGGDERRIEAAALFHDASRQFLRRLLGLLPLLGFLGTVVGLAAAISGLPRGLSGSVDLTASLAGLAIKFETTFLGLAAYLVGSLFVNLLDRLEWEARAGLVQFAAGLSDDASRR